LLKFDVESVKAAPVSAQNTAPDPNACEVKFDDVTVTAPLREQLIRPASVAVLSSDNFISDNDSVAPLFTVISDVPLNVASVWKENPAIDSAPPDAAAKEYGREPTPDSTVTLHPVRVRDAPVQENSDE
jgi:hypothetical protein